MTQPVLAWLSWYILIGLIGLSCLPLALTLFGGLSDRGYAFSKPLGLLCLGYLVWFGASLQLLPNTPGGQLSAWLLLLAVNLWLLRDRGPEMVSWLRQHARAILITEVLFAAVFAFWAYVRAHSPEIIGTEKPMELAFLNSLVHSETLPPADPWLSGYAISYYYFGYVLAGVLTSLSGVAPPVAFNLTIALWFALAATAAYGVTLNLIRLHDPQARPLAGLLGSLMVLVVSNLEGFLEILHTRQLFWVTGPDGQLQSSFWRWLDVKTLDLPPAGDPGLLPSRFWWWWRASRVVRDVNQAGIDIEVIDEFPFFSFLLADIHPHVLALPFVLMGLGLVLLIFSRREDQSLPTAWGLDDNAWRVLAVGMGVIAIAGFGLPGLLKATPGSILSFLAPLLSAAAAAGVLIFLLAVLTGRLPVALRLPTLLLAGWLFGALAFLNTWDFPIYLGLLFFVFAYKLRDLPLVQVLVRAGSTSLAVAIIGVGLYALWYPTFSSQASGIAPNIGFPTKIQHLLVMFLPLLAPAGLWMARLWRSRRPRFNWRTFVVITVGAPLVLFGLSWLLAGGLVLVRGQQAIAAAVDQLGALSVQAGLNEALMDRLRQPLASLALGALLAVCWTLLNPGRETDESADTAKRDTNSLVVIMVATGGLLVLAPEFVYLLDLFGTRMNTVFKFYFAAWILWGVAGAYALYAMRHRLGWAARIALIPTLLGLCYPVMATATRTQNFRPTSPLSLDGGAHLTSNQPADAAAINWINLNLDSGVVAEAIGGSYSEFGRIATYTPLVTVLGWDWHEIQWRGSADPQGSRRADIERMYQTPDWREAMEIVERYQIDYVYIGPLERAAYGAIQPAKFAAFMSPIYEDSEVQMFASVGEGAGG